jgi:multidrug resistance efflux pump
MRFARLIIGSLVIAVAILVIAGEQLSGASADAVINARTTTLRAPIAGTLTLESRALGSRVIADEAVASIQDPLVDDVRLNDLIRERAFSAAETQRLSQAIEAVRQSIQDLEARSASYRRERIRQLEAELLSARSRIAVGEARVEEAAAAFARSSELTQRGLEASASFERNQASQRVAELELDDARQRAFSAHITLEAAKKGTFLGDGYNDAPYSEQQISELSLQRAELESQLEAEREKIKHLTTRVNAERLRVNRLSSAQIQSNVNGSVWEVLAGDRETVQRGQELLRLVDCDSAVVTLSVSENVYNRLKLGDQAMFKLSADGRSYEGTITRLAGAGAATIYRNLAIAPSERHLERYDVTLLVPGLREDNELACSVGRTGRAFFEARPFDFLRQLWS